MILHLVLCQLQPGVPPEAVEAVLRQTRTQLLKIPEVKIIRCGQRIGPAEDWGIFFSLEFENTEKLALFQANPIAQKHRDDVLLPYVRAKSEFTFELEPGKDPRFS